MSATRPTLKAVAAEAGVSIATVSYALSGRPGSTKQVSEESRAAVLAAVEKLGYTPNRAAQAIRTGRTRTIQLSLNMLRDPWSLAVVDAVSRRAQPAGLSTVILPDADWHTALANHQADIAFIDTVDDTPEERAKVDDLLGRGRSLVILSDTMPADGFDVIATDPLPGCQLAMEHLLSLGRNIGCISNERYRSSSAPNRYTVYRDAMLGAGIDDHALRTAWFKNSTESALAAALELLSSANRPTAIYATTDFAGIAAIHAARILNLRVPEDVCITGAGNTPESTHLAPTLTTVGPDDIYDHIARTIVDRALNPTAPFTRTDYPWSLHVRESTSLSKLPEPEQASD